MEINKFFKSIIDSDDAPIVICDTEHKVVYMNPASVSRYKVDITGKSIKNCHNSDSNKKIDMVIDYFRQSKNNNKVHTSFIEKENTDVYMIALRDSTGTLIGYYEKHESRNIDRSEFYKY